MTRIHFALLILSSAVLALRCVPADPTPVVDHTATAVIERRECPCPECDGKGEVEYDGSVPYLPKGKYKCPICGGDGTLIHEGPVYKRCDNPACKCDPCKCDPCKCKEEAQPEQPTPAASPLRAFLVVPCRNAMCKAHCHFVARFEPHIKALNDGGWEPIITVLSESVTADREKIKALGVHADTTPYVAIERDGKTLDGRYANSADEVAVWLNEQRTKHGAEWGRLLTAAAPVLSVVVVSDPERCPPCAALERDREEIEDELNTTFRVLAPGEDAAFAVSSIPTTFVLLDGKVIDKQSGYSGKRRYVAWLRDLARAKGAKWK